MLNKIFFHFVYKNFLFLVFYFFQNFYRNFLKLYQYFYLILKFFLFKISYKSKNVSKFIMHKTISNLIDIQKEIQSNNLDLDLK